MGDARLLRVVSAVAVLFFTKPATATESLSGSASGSSLCSPLASDHPCLNLPNRGTNSSLPQSTSVDADIDDFVIRIGFSIAESMRATLPDPCLDIVEHFLCFLGAPPCDPDSDGQPLLVCDSDCEAFNLLKGKNTCDSTQQLIHEFADNTRNEDFILVIELFERFDCSNVSTYYFSEPESYSDKCTGLLSAESKDEVLNSTSHPQCVPVIVSACAAVFHQPYYIPVPARQESETFASITPISDQLDPFCSNVLTTYACHFIAPPCDPEKGTQLAVCTDSCYALDIINDKCRSQLNAIKQNHSGPFVDFLNHFNCTSPESYLIPGIPKDNETCLNAEDYFDITIGTSSPTTTDGIVVPLSASFASLTFVLVISLVIIITVCVYNKTKLGKWTLSTTERPSIRDVRNPVYLRSSKHESVISGMSMTSLPAHESDVEAEVAKLSEVEVKRYRALFKQSVIQYSSLQFNESLGEGAFGKVYAGVANDANRDISGVPVAIKTIKNIESKEQLTSFMAESLIMKDFQHDHVLGLLGVCLDTPDGSPCIVLPFMANGSVKHFLKHKRTHVLDVNTFPQELSLKVVTQMCLDVAGGMQYLAEKRFVHRDLAARNCMLDSNLVVKVGDFGLARDVYSADYYRAGKGARLPVKWMPPETLTDGISNEKTDVWSYGVTCWEVFSLGQTPYPGIGNHEILQHISTGGRLRRPSLCPEQLFDIVNDCWQYLPEDRPTFDSLLSSLRDYWTMNICT